MTFLPRWDHTNDVFPHSCYGDQFVGLRKIWHKELAHSLQMNYRRSMHFCHIDMWWPWQQLHTHVYNYNFIINLMELLLYAVWTIDG
jgi:hypothetical protein